MINHITRSVLLLSLLLAGNHSMADEDSVIRFGVLSIAQPARIFEQWLPLANYMSQQLGQPVEIIVPRGFGKMKQSISDGKVDFFYINSHVFYRLKQEGKAIAVAQMKNIEGKIVSRSEVFVKQGSGIETIADLKGKNIAYISPMGAGGYMAPRAYLYQSGLKSGVDNQESFTKNLSNSIHGVLLGDYDAATMCGVNYRLMSKKIATGELKVIGISDVYPENVVGARSDLPIKQILLFRQALLTMIEKPRGQALLKNMYSMKIQSFIEYDESMEEMTRSLLIKGGL